MATVVRTHRPNAQRGRRLTSKTLSLRLTPPLREQTLGICGVLRVFFVAGAGFEPSVLAEAAQGTHLGITAEDGRLAAACEEARHEVEAESGSTEVKTPAGGPTANARATVGS